MQCAEGMPYIITSLDKDPGGLIFKSKYIRTGKLVVYKDNYSGL